MKSEVCIMLTSSLNIKSAIQTFILLSCIKWLLIPSYRSTDFDVHRNWLAITHHLPISEWYFDDVNSTTVHTLDYPPLFAFFESSLSNNYITKSLLESGWLDSRCLELLPDDDNDPSNQCVKFQRATVILSDVILFIGAYFATQSMSMLGEEGCGRASSYFTFLLIVTNPGLLMLDHVHFQYNGALLGLLLISIAGMVRGGSQRVENNVLIQTDQRWELLGAGCFGLLLTAKHLYLMLAPLYFFYLLRRHCFIAETKGEDTLLISFSLKRLLILAMVTLVCFLGPFVPFVMQSDPMGQMQQIISRLFPFGRGFVHDYWAANIWALYLFASRIATFVLRKVPIPNNIRYVLETYIPFPEPSPSVVAALLLIGIYPGGINMAWKVGRWSLETPLCNVGKFFIHAVVFCALSGFMLGYHVHEKAIMTAIVPLTLLATNTRQTARLFIRTCTFGIFGILPLLFRVEELPLKVMLYITWMSGAIYGLEKIHHDGGKRSILSIVDYISFTILACVLIFMEVVHPILFLPSGRLEFLPLMMTSVICAIGLIWCWSESLSAMYFGAVKVAWR